MYVQPRNYFFFIRENSVLQYNDNGILHATSYTASRQRTSHQPQLDRGAIKKQCSQYMYALLRLFTEPELLQWDGPPPHIFSIICTRHYGRVQNSTDITRLSPPGMHDRER